MWFYQKDKRVFNVKFGDTRVVEDLDVFAHVGRFSAYDEYIEFELKNGQIFFKGRGIPTAYNAAKGVLNVEFEKGKSDNPMVDAIVLYQGELADTDAAEQPRLRAEWEARIQAEVKKKEDEKVKKEEARLKQREKHKVRNDHYDEYEEEEFEEGGEEIDESDTSVLKRIAKSPGAILGLIFIAILVGAYVFFGGGLPISTAKATSPIIDDDVPATKEKSSGDKQKKQKAKAK
eukprot:TRINITY_DN1139_c0_g1_i1.p1 TRINITY_DN1139_c0_g1~~TRINITY_DN1139_c0_g1_i1.p1  ORF type:complete len:232 (-),score=87.58 TRINITY_DN1139_c0_g1_i1:94-789(-)